MSVSVHARVIFFHLTPLFASMLKVCIRGNKTNGSEEGKGKKKKLRNLLAALLIELPQHFTREPVGSEIGWIDTDAHSRRKEKQSYTHTHGEEMPQTSFHLLFFFDKFD